MDTNNIVKTKGIVISVKKYKESSKILSIFTEKRGVINIFASGALRPKSGLLLATEKFVESEFIFQISYNNYYIKSADILNSNLDLGLNPKIYLIGELICEILEKSMPEHLVDEKAYNLVVKTFEFLLKNQINEEYLKLGFMIKYISHIGFTPIIHHCSNCSSRNYNDMYFSNESGGLICSSCLENNTDCVKISKEEISIIIKLLYSKYEEYVDFNFDKLLLKKISNLIYNYFLFNSDLNELQSQKRIEKLFGV